MSDQSGKCYAVELRSTDFYPANSKEEKLGQG